MSIAHSLSISRGSFSPLPGEDKEENQRISTEIVNWSQARCIAHEYNEQNINEEENFVMTKPLPHQTYHTDSHNENKMDCLA